jgi:FkbM family methyltransferase
MKFIKHAAAAALIPLTSNRLSQHLLQRLVIYAHYLMGVGSGAHASSSGEAAALKSILKNEKAPLVIFDVGANQGQFLRVAINSFSHQQPSIHCFEPAKTTFLMLSEWASNLNGVHLNNFGLGTQATQSELYYDEAGSGLASLTMRRLSHHDISFTEHEVVQIKTLDDYCEQASISNINLLKIDVEGHELDVLRGGSKLFARKAVQAVMFEFGGCNIDTRTFFQDYWYFFHDTGMQLYRITPGGYLHPIRHYQEALEQMVTTNFVALRR